MTMLSVIVPVFNEEQSLEELYKELVEVSKHIKIPFEMLFVDDGSTDGSLETLMRLKKEHSQVKIISFTRNFGQTAAFDAGIKEARGNLIVTMDADLQNNPSDIESLLAKLHEGYDVVAGWRRNRKDTFSTKIVSFFGNEWRRMLTGETIHDSGCSLRVYRKEVFTGVDLYGEMHRFIPAILSLRGFRVGEITVHHRERKHGKSKYTIAKVVRGFLDLLFIVFLVKYASRPLQGFGILGIMTFAAGFLIGLYLSFLKIVYGATLSNRPLLSLSILLMVIGVQFFVLGILAEILIRIYFKTHSMTPYTVRNKS